MKIIEYKNIALVGKPCMIEEGFEVAIARLCFYAIQCELKLYVNSSYRESTVVDGAIVQPATLSNHLIGHAIDANIVDGKTFWNSQKMEGILTGNVLKFIETVGKDGVLRWGGTFSVKDVVHFDDALNIHNINKWHELYNSIRGNDLA